MKVTNIDIPKALMEVWEWKEEVYQDIKDKNFTEKEKYYQEGVAEAVKILSGRLEQNEDGSFIIT